MVFFKENKILQGVAVGAVSFLISIGATQSYATNDDVLNSINNIGKKTGHSYWVTSNIREWLNSDKDNVGYTMPAPTNEVHGKYGYNTEPGFLTNFSEKEKEAIAVTRRRYINNSIYSSEINNIGSKNEYINDSSISNHSVQDLSTDWKNLKHIPLNDKVFFLNMPEYYHYLEIRGLKKTRIITPETMSKYSLSSNKIDWFIGSSYSSVHDDEHVGYSNGSKTFKASLKNAGVVPALHIKPDYIFSNNKKASELDIGSVVEFGKYNNESISWEVINVTNEGYALLLSLNVIDIKPYSTKSDIVYKNSKYINFDSADVDIYNDLQVKPLKNNDITPPEVTIVDESKLFERAIGSFEIEMDFFDESGIKYIQTPNGNKIFNEDKIFFNVSENRDYYFKICDNSDIIREYMLPIGNINIPSQVLINSSSNGWTNKNVSVEIKTSNEIDNYRDEVNQVDRHYYFKAFPNYNSYAGRPLRVSGSVEAVNVSLNSKFDVGLNFTYISLDKGKSGDFYKTQRYHAPKLTPIKTIQEAGVYHFDYTINLPNNILNGFMPTLFMSIQHTDKGNLLKWKDVKLELLDMDGFGIDKIVLPDGTEIKESSYTDVLTQEGEYTYSVYDNNGVITSKTISVLIDKIAPTINIDYNNELTSEGTINISVEDSGSGFSKLVLPNNEECYSSNISYKVTNDATYTFKAYDKAGNYSTKSITVNNIDSIKPVVNISTSNNNNWTNEPIQININARD